MREYLFHSFTMGDVEDPELYAAIPMSEFMQTEKGQWVKANCPDPKYRVRSDPASWGFRVDIYGELSDMNAFLFRLKFAGV